jgi:hypothetical protein
MAIPQEHNWRYIFHFTDIRNLDSIIMNGLLCTNLKDAQNITHKNIANMTIQERRAKMEVTCGKGGVVHDYVPFYFTSKNPMLLGVLNKKNTDQPFIIYLCLKIERLEKDDAVFTDASANTDIPPNFYSDTVNLNKLDWGLIDSKNWAFNDDERHKKMAEALIFNRVGIEETDAIVVYNNRVADGVRKIFEKNGITPPPILLDNGLAYGRYRFFYTKYFLQGRDHETLIMGPYFLKQGYQQLLEQINQNRQANNQVYKYEDIPALVKAIEQDIRVIPELNGVYQMPTSKSPLTDTVDIHLQKVAANIQNTDFYRKADEELKNVMKLAAYLHDIGKGPLQKWNGYVQYIYVDHTYDAIPMLHRIFTQDIRTVSEDSIRRVCLAVVYHNIAGDCILKGRDRREMADVINDENDIDMLIAMNLADVQATNTTWYQQMTYCKRSLKKDVMDLKGLI